MSGGYRRSVLDVIKFENQGEDQVKLDVDEVMEQNRDCTSRLVTGQVTYQLPREISMTMSHIMVNKSYL